MPRKRKINVPVAIAEEVNDENDASNSLPNFLRPQNSQKLAQIAAEAQKNDSYHEKCMKQVIALYSSMEHKIFMQVIIHITKFALSKKEMDEYGNCMVRFLAKTLTSFKSENDCTHPVLSDTLDWLLSTISADAHIRFRMCFFVNALLSAMGLDAQLEDHTCNNIQQYMLDRLRDINANVRVQAVYALMRLQDPEDPNDRVIRAYIFHIEFDPSPKVRQATITAVAKNSRTIAVVIGRLWDVDEKVRRHTICQMAKFPVRQYKIIQRLKIIEQALKDQSNSVRQACTRILLPQWIESYQRNYIAFITSLKVDATEEELYQFKKVAIDALMEIFEKHPIKTVIDSLGLTQSEQMERCIAPEELTIEKIILWQAVIKFLNKTGVADVDEVLPDLITMSSLLHKFVEVNQHKYETNTDNTERLTYQFSLYCLLEIISEYDFGDEVGRSKIKEEIFDLLKTSHIEESSIKMAIKILEYLLPSVDDRFYRLCEMLRAITEYQDANLNAAKLIVDSYLEKNPNIEFEIEIRQQSTKILELKEQLANFIKQKDDVNVQKINEEIDSSTEVYKSLIRPILESSTDESAVSLADSLYRKKRLNIETLMKCLRIFFYMVSSKNVKHVTVNVIELYQKLVCIYVGSQEIDIRYWALKCSSACAMLYENIAKDVFLTLYKQFTTTSSAKIWRITILCLFEMLDLYGFVFFNLEKEHNNTKRGRVLFNSNISQDEDDEPSENNDISSLMRFMSHLMENCDDDSIKATIAKCYCRLILHGHISSTDIVVKILLKYFNPATEDELSQALGIFFENLIEHRKQELLQEALLPTITAIVDAPNKSPLAEIEIKTVIRFVIQSTKPDPKYGLNIHDTIAMTFLSAIKDMDYESNKDLIKTLANEMNTLEISGDQILRENFKSCVNELLTIIEDQKITKILNDFMSMLDESSTRLQQDLTPVTTRRSDNLECESETSGSILNDDSSVFKVPPARPKPTFDAEISNTVSLNVPASPENENNNSDAEELSLATLVIPATQELETPRSELDVSVPASSPEHLTENESNLLENIVIPSTQEEMAYNKTLNVASLSQESVAQSPVEHLTIWSKNKNRGVRPVAGPQKKTSEEKNKETVEQKKRGHPPSSSDSSAVNSPVRKVPKSIASASPTVRTRRGAQQELLANSLVTRNRTVNKTPVVDKRSSTTSSTSSPNTSQIGKKQTDTLAKKIVLSSNSSSKKSTPTNSPAPKTNEKTPKASTKTPMKTLELPSTPTNRSARLTPRTPTTPSTPIQSKRPTTSQSAITITPSSIAAITPRTIRSATSSIKAGNASTPVSSKLDSGIEPRKTRSLRSQEPEKPTTRSRIDSGKKNQPKNLGKK